jgi:16S rRNA (guanine966-N2)-methyltransferase
MTQLRITAGTFRGRRVGVPHADVRPTSERARQAFFNIVGPRIDGARFLDLFAGSGIFSFEAGSRGAIEAVAIDDARDSMKAVDKLAATLEAPVRTITTDVFTGIKRLGSTVFDVIYADPPYTWLQYDELLLAIDSGVRLSPDVLVAIEHRRRTEPFTAEAKRLRFIRRAEYGEVWISFFSTEE